MVKSMTGFGRGETIEHGYSFSIEMKSVNNRYLEVVVKLPRIFQIYEERIRKVVQGAVVRGRVEVYVNVKEIEEKKRLVKVDKELALSYDNSLKELAQLTNSVYHTDIYKLISLPEILSVEEDEADLDSLWPAVEKAVGKALVQFRQMREDEGESLLKDLYGRIDTLEELTAKIKKRSPDVVLEYQAKLRERLATLLTDMELDETRMMMEVAILADRVAIDEEIVRMESHLTQFKKILQMAEPMGRKLDFLVQEMNREVNTIGSKANDLAISHLVVEAKSELEKIREQIQNIE